MAHDSTRNKCHFSYRRNVISHFENTTPTRNNMTVKQKMNEVLQNSDDYLDCGQYHIDGRDHGILQNTKNTSIKVVYKSKDDIDDNGQPLTKEMDYKNLKEFIKDYKLTY